MKNIELVESKNYETKIHTANQNIKKIYEQYGIAMNSAERRLQMKQLLMQFRYTNRTPSVVNNGTLSSVGEIPSIIRQEVLSTSQYEILYKLCLITWSLDTLYAEPFSSSNKYDFYEYTHSKFTQQRFEKEVYDSFKQAKTFIQPACTKTKIFTLSEVNALLQKYEEEIEYLLENFNTYKSLSLACAEPKNPEHVLAIYAANKNLGGYRKLIEKGIKPITYTESKKECLVFPYFEAYDSQYEEYVSYLSDEGEWPKIFEKLLHEGHLDKIRWGNIGLSVDHWKSPGTLIAYFSSGIEKIWNKWNFDHDIGEDKPELIVATERAIRAYLPKKLSLFNFTRHHTAEAKVCLKMLTIHKQEPQLIFDYMMKLVNDLKHEPAGEFYRRLRFCIKMFKEAGYNEGHEMKPMAPTLNPC